MQDFPIQVNITGGLAPRKEAEGLVTSINLRALGKGLESVLAPKSLYTLAGVAWPFPQVFRLAVQTFVCLEDTILRVDGGYLTPVVTNIPNAGYPWGAAEVGGYKVFTNNKVVVAGGASLVLDTEHKIPAGLDICATPGQFIIAAPWAYGTWQTETVMWSKIGSADFTIDRSNIAAERYAGVGTVMRVLPFMKKTLSGLHYGFAAYGTEGVATYLTAAHPAIFSQMKSYPVGMHSSRAVAGTEQEQFFVDKNFNLCQLKDGEVKVLGYQQHLKGVRGEIVLSYDAFNKELWVAF